MELIAVCNHEYQHYQRSCVVLVTEIFLSGLYIIDSGLQWATAYGVNGLPCEFFLNTLHALVEKHHA